MTDATAAATEELEPNERYAARILATLLGDPSRDNGWSPEIADEQWEEMAVEIDVNADPARNADIAVTATVDADEVDGITHRRSLDMFNFTLGQFAGAGFHDDATDVEFTGFRSLRDDPHVTFDDGLLVADGDATKYSFNVRVE